MSQPLPDAPRPIVVRRVKKVVHGHHGGAWKVAYADFVTAMMAFFLLMWLLASVEAGDRAEVANYFKRPLNTIFAAGGTEPGGDRIIASSQTGGTRSGVLLSGSDQTPTEVGPDGFTDEAVEAARLESLQREFEALAETNPIFSEYEDQLRFDLTEEGLAIQIIDDLNRPMFGSGSAALAPHTRALLTEIARELDGVPNRLSISGHTDATPYSASGREAGYSNWELSADRANAARRTLVAAGVREDKLARVDGVASSQPLDPADPTSAVNRRISILLLRDGAPAP